MDVKHVLITSDMDVGNGDKWISRFYLWKLFTYLSPYEGHV
jgi:hypothetical protein